MVRHYRSFLYAGISLVGIRGRFVVSDHLQARTPFLSLFLTFTFFTLIFRVFWGRYRKSKRNHSMSISIYVIWFFSPGTEVQCRKLSL